MANLANCLIDSGYELGCLDGLAGINAVYVMNDNISPFNYTIGTTASAGMITAFGTTSSAFYEIEGPQETLAYTTTGNISKENQTLFYEHSVELTLYKVSTETHTYLRKLVRGAYKIMIRTNDNKYFLLNPINGFPAQASAVTGGSGKAMSDLSGYTVTITVKTPTEPIEVTTAAALSVISTT